MNKSKKNIEELKTSIKDETKKIRKLKKNLRAKKREKFKKTKLGKFVKKITFLFSQDKENYSFSELFITTIVSLIVGVFATISLLTIFTGGRNYLKNHKELSKFYDVFETISTNYYGNISKQELVENAISGMVQGVGDTYTSYADNDATSSFSELINGVYEGIGCAIQEQENKIRVAMVYENSPASRAGIKVDDIIVKVDELDATKEGATKLSEYIKKTNGKKIKLEVLRGESTQIFTLSRNKVEIPVIDAKILNSNHKKVGYLKISLFSSVSSKQFIDKLIELENNKIDSLIIDVRDNNGGYLSEVSSIASYLLPKGKKIYQTERGNKKIIAKDKTFAKRTYPIAILVNQNSASASEILAGAIKESYGGFVVGTKTFGKGTVQQVKKLSDGSMIKYTIETWLTPNGNWINEKGIEPTDIVDLSEEYFKEPKEENDNQLQKALCLVTK